MKKKKRENQRSPQGEVVDKQGIKQKKKNTLKKLQIQEQ
jgi:hypothetical protein